jgi:hypothetical protein
MSTRRATEGSKALDAFMTTQLWIDAMVARLTALSDDHFEAHLGEINWGDVGTPNH